MKFTKLVAAGNDFIFTDQVLGLDSASLSDFVRKICDRHFGIGADGFVHMEILSARKSRWQFFNNDGSPAEFCGNAARASAVFLDLNQSEFPHQLETVFGVVTLRKDIQLTHPYTVEMDYSKHPLEMQSLDGGGVLVNTGVPHVVVGVSADTMKNKPKRMEWVGRYRFHPQAGPKGANVTFFVKTATNQIQAVTFERGVEDETLSCGTGVLAAAMVSQVDQVGSSTVEVKTPGGDFQVKLADDRKQLWLNGPAQRVFQTELDLKELETK